jgi:class 3 adenylate cyclase/tetratricopeptide (TPR) repeat protein
MQACPSCGSQNDDAAKFCSQCGSVLAKAAVTRREERKIVTVVFADIVGSTARADRLDPEDVQAILAPYHERLRHELERHGGSVEKFIGDAVVGVFGAPIAHEDDAERAVRAALAIQTAIAELNDADPALELEVRIGVNSGEALVSLDARPEAGEAMVAGDVMNVGARLQSAAPPAAVLVSDSTYRATSRAIEYEPAEPIEAKGKSDPLGVWIAVAPRARFGLDVFQTGRAQLVGRERELDLLAAALARARAEREPQLVTLVGVPGIGKSRLVYELWRIVDDDPDLIVWRQGRSLPYGEGVAFRALGEIVKAQAGILETDSAATVEAKLGATVEDLVSEHEREWVERHLRPIVGLGGDLGTGEGYQAEAFAAWRRFFEALAERWPAVLVFEDLQWADDGLLDFVDGLVERVAGVSLLVVCSARPELLERRSGWGGGKRNALAISLPPLSEADTARLLADLLERPVLPADEQTALLQRAGGNPLYAEEYARMLDAGTSVGDVPETLQGVVTARIDALPGEEKEVLQQAAVLGKVFWTDALEKAFAIDAWVLEERLHALERKEFVRRDHRSAVAGARQYVFVHALVRDGAYGQMPRAARARAHERVSDWIDRLPADRTEDRAEMLAHHLVYSVEYGRAAGLDVSSLVSRAGRALVEAGDRAWRLGAAEGALSFYEHARSLDPTVSDDPYFLLKIGTTLLYEDLSGVAELEQAAVALEEPDPAAAAVAVMTAGEVHWQRGDHDGAFAYFDRAALAVETLPPSREKLDVTAQLARFLTLAGRRAEGLARAEEAIAMAQQQGDDDFLIDVLNTRGLVRMHYADTAWQEDLESSLALALERGSWRAGRSYLNLGSSLLSQAADVRRSHSVTREGLQFTEKLGGFKISMRWFQANLAESGFHLGEWGESLELVEQELADPEPSYLRPQCSEVRAHMRLVRGDPEGALADAEQAADEARAIVDPQAYLPALATLAFVSASLQDAERAGAAIEELVALLEELGPSGGTGGAWIVDLALALVELGREHELLDHTSHLAISTPWLEAAREIARGQLVDAAVRLGTTGSVAYESSARLSAARRLSAEGRHAEAERQLTPALAFYRSVGASAAVREGESLLAAAS